MSILSPSKLAPRAAGSTTDTDNFFNDAFNDDLTSHAPANFGSFSGASGLTESPSTSQAASVASDVISGVVASPETITLQGSGLVFINTYGSGVTDAYRSAIIAAENNFQSHFTNNVTLRVSFDLQLINTNFSGQNSFGQSLVTNVPYSSLRTALINHATTADDIAAVNSLPVTDPSNGLGFDLPIGMARILNLVPAGTGNDDAIVLNSYYWNNSNFSNGVGVLEHEISEGAMGRIGSLGIWDTGNWAPMDLFRYSAVGQRDYTGGSDSRPTYFSVDGTQLLTQFHNSLVYNAAQGRFVYDGYDLADWDHTSGDSFGPGGPNSPGVMTATDLRVMDILGWTPTGSSLSDDYRNSLTDLSHPFGTVAVNGSSTGRLEVVGDRDWFSVQLVAGTTYTISLQGTASGSGTLQDPYLRVHNMLERCWPRTTTAAIPPSRC